MCDLDPKVKVIGKKAVICDGVPSTAALVTNDLKRKYFFRKNVHSNRPSLFKVKFLETFFVGSVGQYIYPDSLVSVEGDDFKLFKVHTRVL